MNLLCLVPTLVLSLSSVAVWADSNMDKANQPNVSSNNGIMDTSTPSDLKMKEKWGLVDYDAHILSKIHMANQDEIKMGKLAQSNGESQSVKDYGTKLISDHQAVDDQLYKVSNGNREVLGNPPLTISDKEKAEMQQSKDMYTQLSSLQGADFDKAFKQAMIDDHKKDISDLQTAIPRIHSPSVKQFVQNVIPKLRAHEQLAMNLKLNPQA